MIVNKSMYPLQTGFSVISKMQNQFANLQVQLGTGLKAQTLSDMGRDLPVSLSARSRLSTIAGYKANIEQVDLRLSFYDNALSRMDKIEGEARNSAVQGQYGSNNINMATVSSLSKARLDEMVTLLNSDIGGRYLFGGARTDDAPLPTTTELLEGSGSRVGYRTVLSERVMADLGADGIGRLEFSSDAVDPVDPTLPVTVTLSEDAMHSFGFKLTGDATASGNINADKHVDAGPPRLEFTFPAPPDTVSPGATVSVRLRMPDGESVTVSVKAVAEESTPPAVNEFKIGANAAETSEAFIGAMERSLKQVAAGELKAASSFVAAENFFNAAGEPVLRVDAGSPADPYSATSLRVATATDTVMWYSGETAAVSAIGMGRLTTGRDAGTVTLTQNMPVSNAHGFQIADAVSSNTAAVTAVRNAGPPVAMTVEIANNAALAANDTVTFTLSEPGGKTRPVTLTAVTGTAGPGQFKIGADAAQTAANFQEAMVRSVTEAAADAEGNPRQSVSAAVEDAGRVNYGMQANESGYLRLVRSLAAMSVETYPEVRSAADPNSIDLNPAKARFDAMARRQQLELSESHNSEKGSLELVTMELGVARAGLQSASQRHTDYSAQLENLLSDVESVNKEDVAMQILALQTRLTASYQVTSMVSQLSLVNFL
ncbi:hypothetical protein IC608_02115 [Devosia sp. PTR5]|uniref:Flagellin N-terminal domain-containing protein n=1 Tax=Devosia oryzisoli TaxID=2774138 RepID=A0A927FQQ0_9HYPH|nr:hypothetical protein [Devosia oryzisoli]MBD8064271.1 hypothetical protein [Devosia oryzisoli]